MEKTHEILVRDIQILEAMVAELPDYLMSDAPRWTLQPNMPPLTIGGCLMRLHRLHALRNKLSPALHTRLKKTADQFDEALVERVVRFETRAHQELHARLGEWANCMRTLQCAAGEYANKVDTRVVIDALIQALQKPPYQLQPQVLKERDSLDQHLRGRWQPGEFVWMDIWQQAYPRDKYWWLYGQPAVITEQSVA